MPPRHSYYDRRAADERRLAEEAAEPRARKVHLELAMRYANLSDLQLDAPEVQNVVADRLLAAARKCRLG